VHGVEVHPEGFNNGYMIRLGLDANLPKSNKVFAVRHSDMDMLGGQPCFLGIEYDASHGKVGGYLDWNTTASAGSAVMLIPHDGNNRTNRYVAFPGGIQLGAPSDLASHNNPGNPVRNPHDYGYIGANRADSDTYAAYYFGINQSPISNVEDNAGTVRLTTLEAVPASKIGLRHIVTAVPNTSGGIGEANGFHICTAAGTTTRVELPVAFSGTYDRYSATLASAPDNSTYTTLGYSTIEVSGASGTIEAGDRICVDTGAGQRDMRVRSAVGSTITVYGNFTAGVMGDSVLRSSGYVIQAQALGWHTAAPTAGKWSRGDIMHNLNPVTSGIAGWVCTVGGTSGGTWKAFTHGQETNLDSSLSYVGQTYTLRAALASGGAAGTADVVTLLDTSDGLPYAIRIVDVSLYVSTLVVGATVTLKDDLTAADGTGGTAYSDAMSTALAGHIRSNYTATSTVAAGKGLKAVRSDRSMVGEIVITYVIT
jgi:hypothetical protein